MIRTLSRKRVLRDASPSLGAQASLGAALYLCPPALIPVLGTARQGAGQISRPTFLGFRTLEASLSSGLGGREIKTLAVGRVIKALPVVDRALEPTGLLCCSPRPRPWGRSTWGEGSRALVWRLGKWLGAVGARGAMRAWGGPKAGQLPLKVCTEGREAEGAEGWGVCGHMEPSRFLLQSRGKHTGFGVQQTWCWLHPSSAPSELCNLGQLP